MPFILHSFPNRFGYCRLLLKRKGMRYFITNILGGSTPRENMKNVNQTIQLSTKGGRIDARNARQLLKNDVNVGQR